MLHLSPFKILQLFILIMFGNVLNAQEKYQSLLWKIEGNGLKKTSYLYGTMHVSSKIAFNLGDEFFDALSSADAVALETNPEYWLDFYRSDDLREASNLVYDRRRNFSGVGFYTNFTVVPEYELEVFRRFLSPKERMLNELLYRYNYGQENYEESTYLDMFLFQAAKKKGKPIFSLEDFMESFFLARRSSLPDEDTGNSKKRRLGRQSQEKLETAYLERNLDELDSMISQNFSNNYRKYLLDIRNENMVDALDSLMPKMSVFAGVGAAHLAGEKGMIEMLREKGYTVTPVEFSKSTGANKTFRKIKKSAVDPPTKIHSSSDNRIQLQSIGKFYPENENSPLYYQTHFLPDFANGAYYSYERMVKIPYGKSFASKCNLNYIDSTLYLITPGEISKRKKVKISGYDAIDVTTEMSRNNFLKMLIVDTPQEIIVFKAGGNKAFIKSKNVKAYFSSISIKPMSQIPDLKKQGVEVKIPEGAIGFIGEKNRVLIAGTDDGKNYFSFHSEFLQDFNNLEVDSFELDYLINTFAENAELETEKKEIGDKKATAILSGKDKKLNIFYAIHHNTYYQLISEAENERAEKYFQSLKFSDPDYTNISRKVEKDTALNYRFSSYFNRNIDSLILAEIYSLKEDFVRAENREDSLNTDFRSEYTTRLYEDPVTGSQVLIRHTKVNTYSSVEKGAEGIEKQLQLKYSEDSLYYDVKMLRQVKTDSSLEYLYQYSKKGTDRVLYLLDFVFEDQFVTVTSSFDTIYGKPIFIDQIYSTFKPLYESTSEKEFVLNHKGLLWLEHIKSDNYQLREQAKLSVSEVVFDDKSREPLEELLLNDTLKVLDESFRSELLGIHYYFFHESENYLDFILKFYEKFKNKPVFEINALQYLSKTGTAEAASRVISLLEQKAPIVSNENDIYRIFKVYYDSLELLVPHLQKMQEFTLEYEEYLPEFIHLIDKGNLKGKFSTNDLSDKFLRELENLTYKKMRKMSYARSEKKSEFEDLMDELIPLASVLYCYTKDESRFKEELRYLDTISDPRFKANVLAKRINRKRPYTLDEIRKVMEDTVHIFDFFSWVSESNLADSLYNLVGPEKHLFYQSYIMSKDIYGINKDSLRFDTTVFVSSYKKSGVVYLFTTVGNYGDSKKFVAVYFVDPEEQLTFENLKTKSKVFDAEERDEVMEYLLDDIRYVNRPRVSSNRFDW
ncbi:MAG: TraB/GumN family protein [Brumimicrobium sp.]|nr:TraB/GumN family protein [Brumimicrobium sp.]